MRQTFAIVVERGPESYGAYAPDLFASFVTAPTFEEAVRGVEESLALQLRLYADMGDRLPDARPETAPGLERAALTPTGAPADPEVRFVLREVGPEDAPPAAPPEPAGDRPAPPPRRETFAVVLEKGTTNFGGHLPDLPGCVAVGNTLAEVREDLRIGLREHAQAMVDDDDEIPERRRSRKEALVDYAESVWEDESSWLGGETVGAIAERMTVDLQPPRPQARRLNAMSRAAWKRRRDFEETAVRRLPVAPGSSWSGSYVAIFDELLGKVRAKVPDLPDCRARGDTAEEATRNLRARILEILRESLEKHGALPLPRRSPAQALAHHNRRLVEFGLEVPDPTVEVRWVPVEITAPAIACAS